MSSSQRLWNEMLERLFWQRYWAGQSQGFRERMIRDAEASTKLEYELERNRK